MTRYCDQCGAKIEGDSKKFCNQCGAVLPEISNTKPPLFNTKDAKIIIGLLVVVIILFLMFIVASGALDFRNACELNIKTSSPMTASDSFEVKLSNENGAVSGETIKVTFSNNGKNHEYSSKTNSKGVATVYPSLDLGDYDVKCEFGGGSGLKPASATKQVTIKEAEPDYQSYYYTHSFEDTDSNGDGYVTLNEMNIAHTPKNIQDRMLADSDNDKDGRLNHDEYYKFMYKLNYDYHSYGL